MPIGAAQRQEVQYPAGQQIGACEHAPYALSGALLCLRHTDSKLSMHNDNPYQSPQADLALSPGNRSAARSRPSIVRAITRDLATFFVAWCILAGAATVLLPPMGAAMGLPEWGSLVAMVGLSALAGFYDGRRAYRAAR
ncbi:MAG: hypothetical protein ACOY3P_16785 [Planctomycetota bacterium]